MQLIRKVLATIYPLAWLMLVTGFVLAPMGFAIDPLTGPMNAQIVQCKWSSVFNGLVGFVLVTLQRLSASLSPSQGCSSR